MKLTGYFSAAFALFLVSDRGMAAPGGYLVEGISDEFDAPNSIWGPGLRGMPEYLSFQDGVMSIRSIDADDDGYPSAEDMISTYQDQLGRPLHASEGPNVVAFVWMPPFSQWPTGTNASGLREWFGFRVTAYDADLPFGSGYYWPGIYLSTDDDGPCFIARVGDGYAPDIAIGRITSAGWWTLGLAWNEQGRTEYYAAPGRVTLTENDRLHTTPTYGEPDANRSFDQLIGNFLALRMTYPATGQLSPDWRLDAIRVYVKTPPTLPRITIRMESGVRLDIVGCSRGFRYRLEKSDDLISWSPLEEMISDGAPRIFHDPVSSQRFYRVTRP